MVSAVSNQPCLRRAAIPFDEPIVEVDLVALYAAASGSAVVKTPVYYLHGMRSGVLVLAGKQMQEQYAALYYAHRDNLVGRLSAAVAELGVSDAAGVCPPSSRHDAQPYLEALWRVGVISVDLSVVIRRVEPSFRAGRALSLAEVLASMATVARPTADPARTLVIVDDVVSSGRTAAATASVLMDGGFVAQTARILVACALGAGPEWVPAGHAT
jgi:hypothetical protein